MEGTEYEFRFSKPHGYSTHVAIHSNTYDKRLSHADKLLEELKRSIPFPFTEKGAPELHILGGRRVRGIMSVELWISYEVSDAEAAAQLGAKGYFEGLEEYLG